MPASADLLALLRRGAAPRGDALRGLGDSWRDAERSIAAEMHADPKKARRLVESFALLADMSGEREARGRAERLRGSWLVLLGRNADAARVFGRAAALLSGTARDSARLGLAVAWIRTGRRRAAERLCRDVRRAAAARGETLLAAGADFNAALAAQEDGRPKNSIALYVRAKAAYAAAGDARHAALAAQNLANAYVALDRFDEALPLFEEAGDALGALGAAHESARVRYNRGALLVASGRLGDAERELAAVERDAARAGDAQLASLARLDRGEALLRAGLTSDAARVLDSAARGLGRGAATPELVRAALLRARAAVMLGRPATARRIVERSKSPTTRAWDADRAEISGLALAVERRFGEARRTLERAAAAFGATRPVARARATCAAGWCAFDAGDFVTAGRLARVATRLAKSPPLAGPAFDAAALQFAVLDESGRRRESSAVLRRALAALERVREDLGGDAMRAAVLRGRERWFARAVRHLLAAPDGARRALALIEKWRARALVDLVASAARVEEGGGKLAALRTRVAAIERRLAGGDGAPFVRSGVTARAPAPARALGVAERRLHDAVVREVRATSDAGFSLDALRASVPDDTALVSYFADDRGAVAFVVRRDVVRAVDLPVAGDELRALVETLHFGVGKFAFGPEFVARRAKRLAVETDRTLAAIAARTIEPLADELRGVARVVVAPHGSWHEVPFAALPFDGARLVDRVAVAMTPSFAALAPRVDDARGRPVVLAVSDARTPSIVEEGRAVAAAAGDAVLLEGDAATSAALRAAAGDDRGAPRFVHVAAHGRFRADVPAMSGVALADGWLRAVDFHSLRLDGSLVVLSGCETGASRVDAVGEVQGLVRGVMSSGAAELVVSLWRVDDASTAALMSRFHALRAAGETTERALAAAQREAAASGRHPWRWAGFVAWTRRLS